MRIVFKDRIRFNELDLSAGTILYLNRNGQIHRKNGPAIILPNGDKHWYKKGKVHRIGAPAIITKNAYIWTIEGISHRDGDEPTNVSGSIQTWIKHGEVHRDFGPAFICPGQDDQWYFHDRCLIKGNAVTHGKRNKDQQEFIIRNRPDLICQIQELDPELREKYRHELNLSGVEI
jgi:hypothetical protein